MKEACDSDVTELDTDDDGNGIMSVADDSENDGSALEGKEKVRWGVPVKRDRAG